MNNLPQDQMKELLSHLQKAKTLISEIKEEVDNHYANCDENMSMTGRIADTKDQLSWMLSDLDDTMSELEDLRHVDLSPYSRSTTE